MSYLAPLITLYTQGQLVSAFTGCQQVFKQHASDPVLLNLMACIASDMGDAQKSLEFIAKAIRIDPENADYQINQLTFLVRSGQLKQAISTSKIVLSNNPNSLSALKSLAEAYRKAGLLEDAVLTYQKLLALKPDDPTILTSLAIAYKNQGEFKQSTQYYEQAIRLNPKLSRAYWGLAFVNPATQDSNLIDKIQENLEDETLSSADRIYYDFALFKQYEDLCEYKTAFTYLSRANALKNSTLQFDYQATKRFFHSIRDFYTKEWLKQKYHSKSQGKDSIFIVGMPRSGTTLVEQILSAHPDVVSAGESKALGLVLWHALNKVEGEYPVGLSSLNSEQLKQMSINYLNQVSEFIPAKSQIVIDKMPHNFLHLGLISTVLPQARIICLNRHPYDVCLSNYMQLYASGHEYSYDLRNLGLYYQLFADLMNYWREVIPDKIIDVNYAELVEHSESSIQKLLSDCGLSWSEACLEHNRAKSAIRTASAVQAKQAIYQSSNERWKKYEAFLGPLFDVLQC